MREREDRMKIAIVVIVLIAVFDCLLVMGADERRKR